MSTDFEIYIDRFIPRWILEEYAGTYNKPSMEKFFIYWLEFLAGTDSDSKDRAIKIFDNLLFYSDIDSTDDKFLSHFINKLAPTLPMWSLSEETMKILIKKARDFYKSKGTVDSIKFFFKIFYGKDVVVNRPSEKVLRVSDGKWYMPINVEVTGLTSEVRNNILTNPGNFLVDITDSEDNIITVPINDVELSGSNLVLEISDAYVGWIDIGNSVAIKEFKSTGLVQVDSGTIASEPNHLSGYWLNNDGKLNSDRYLQDSSFYQDYSYELVVDLPESEYIKDFMNILHPVGYKIFTKQA